jgi:hypothetical protein
MLGKTSMTIIMMRIQSTLDPFHYGLRGLKKFWVTTRVIDRIVVLWKQINIMNHVMQWTIFNIKDTRHMAR